MKRAIAYAAATAALFLGSISSAGCEKADQERPPRLDPAEFEGVDSAGQVKIVSSGAEPRELLRYQFEPGAKVHLALDMVVNSKVAVDGNPMDVDVGMSYGTDMEIVEVTAAGDARMRFVNDGFAIDESKTSPLVAQAMKSIGTDAMRMGGTQVLDPRGRIVELRMDLGAMRPELRETMRQMEDSMKQLAAALPEEPVGVGARWHSRQVIKTKGIEIRQRTTMELVKRDGSVVELAIELIQDADIQIAELAGSSGPATEVVSFWSRGSGTTVLDLSSFAPLEMRLKMQTRGDMKMKMPHADVSMKMDAKMKLDAKGVSR